MPPLRFDSPLQYVKGVGPRRAEALASLGLTTIGDLLEYFPFRYDQELGEIEICDLAPGTTATIRGEVLSVGSRWPNYRATVSDGTGSCTLRWFNVPASGVGIYRGATVIATGEVKEFNNELQLVQPRLTVFAPDAVLAARKDGGARLAGVYRGNEQLGALAIRRIVAGVLEAGRLPIDELLPAMLVERRGLLPRERAVRDMHLPADEAAAAAARRRFAYEELLFLQLALAMRRQRTSREPGRVLRLTPEIDARIRRRFPFALTAAQDHAVGEIARDLAAGRAMTRLLQGDVGCGKTVVALHACLTAVAHRTQAAILAPTELLASQHFDRIEQYLAGSRVRRELLRGGMPAAARRDLLARIDAGDVDLVVGTQALLEADVSFADLALVVVDEQHKFGVRQRADMRTKGPMPHYLVMTATPIPRTLAMTVFGDLDVSVIADRPPGRGRIVTQAVRPAEWRRQMTALRSRLERGEQAYVVCPLIGDDPDDPGESADGGPRDRRISVHEAYDALVGGPWAGLRVEKLHGDLPAADKARIVEEFRAGRLHALVSTTVVEVGVDVSAATIMVIESVECFGLSQLHQLRGRVGRGSADALCLLLLRTRSEKALERVKVMTETNDGFRIAEADLRQRGPGEVLGTRQHGLPRFRVADILFDLELLQQARDDAFELVARDPTLAQPANQGLRAGVQRLFADRLALVDIA